MSDLFVRRHIKLDQQFIFFIREEQSRHISETRAQESRLPIQIICPKHTVMFLRKDSPALEQWLERLVQMLNASWISTFVRIRHPRRQPRSQSA